MRNLVLKIKVCYLLIVLFCFLATIQLVAQSSTFEFKNYTTADGLSQSGVIAIAQDNQGMMWFGTRDGLNRFDGSNFKIFRNEEGNPNSLSNNDILAIAVAEDGIIWIGTYDGLNSFNPQNEKFTRYTKEGNNSSNLPNNTIWTIDIRSSNEIVIGTSDGLSILNTSK